MQVLMGPILYAGDSDPETWQFRIQLLLIGDSETPPPLSVEVSAQDASIQGPSRAYELRDYRGQGACYWRWTVDVPRDEADNRWISYELVPDEGEELSGLPHDRRTFEDVCIPRQGALPNFAFFSCNGVSEEKQYHQLDKPQRMWSSLLKRHRQLRRQGKDAFHLLIGGGDQVYADELWTREPLSFVRERSHEEVAETNPAELAERAGLEATREAFRAKLVEQYVGLYVEHWTRPKMRDVFARIPGVFTWDDHDIMDGWGSRPGEREESRVYRNVYRAAEETFRAFQLGGDDLPHRVGDSTHYLQTLTFWEPDQDLTLVLLDIRSGRSRDQVLSDDQWSDLTELLSDDRARGQREDEESPDVGCPRHVVVVSSIPLVHLRFPVEEVPFDAKGLTDDLIDQWEHPNHRGERARLLMRLLRHAQGASCRVTFLSGDVHVGARGRIVSEDPAHVPDVRTDSDQLHPSAKAIVHQVTASAIGHPPPSWWQWKAMRLFGAESADRIADQVEAGTEDVTSSRSYIRARNWLSGRFDGPERASERGETRLWCQWIREDGDPTEDVGWTAVKEALVIPARAPGRGAV